MWVSGMGKRDCNFLITSPGRSFVAIAIGQVNAGQKTWKCRQGEICCAWRDFDSCRSDCRLAYVFYF